VRHIIEESYQRAKNILIAHRDKLDEITRHLVEEETLEAEAFEAFFEPVGPGHQPQPLPVPAPAV
jgi:cell division protease FtsH